MQILVSNFYLPFLFYKFVAGEDSEWTTNDEVVSGSDVIAKCDVNAEQHQQPSPPSRPEPEEPPAANDRHPTLRLNPNLATDPARWSLADKPSPPQPPLPPPPPPSSGTLTAAPTASSSESSSSSSSSSSLSSSAIGEPTHNVVTITAPRGMYMGNIYIFKFPSKYTISKNS